MQVRVATSISRPILPLPPCNYHHSNRTDPLRRLTPLPPRHCHSPCIHDPLCHICHIHCQISNCHVATSISRSILPLPPCNYHHSNRTDLLHRLTPLPPRHCHSPCIHDPLCHICHIHCQISNCHVATSISRSILPLPQCLYNHSNRTDPLRRLTPQPPCHCHYPCDRGLLCHICLCLYQICHCHIFNYLYLNQYCHCHRVSTTIRTAVICCVD
jgi:hypothetical protein